MKVDFQELKMTTDRTKPFAIIFFVSPLLIFAAFKVMPVKAAANRMDDPAVKYAASCKMCHTANASKFFDATKADDVLVATVLQGKKTEKPPMMPGFEAKGMTAVEAKGLVTYMKSLRAPAN
jgi:mono/diheme cytochrome c family protein